MLEVNKSRYAWFLNKYSATTTEEGFLEPILSNYLNISKLKMIYIKIKVF
jgi:hypothetical protein